MSEHDNREARVVKLGQELRRSTVREVPGRTGYSPLHHRGIFAGAKLDLIVVGLEHDRCEIPKEVPNRRGGTAQIVGYSDACLV